MSKRRRRDLLLKPSQINDIEEYTKVEDYTADFESYDFESKGEVADIDENHQQSIKQQDQYEENVKIENTNNIIDNCEEQINDNLCRDFVRNVCRRGKKCKFKHPTVNQNNNRIKKHETQINANQFEVNFCHDYQNNGCNRPQCRFIHCNRPEQEFYYATGILLSSVPCNNLQVTFCKDFLNGSCSRVKCKYLHMTKEEIEQQNNQTNQSNDYSNYKQRPTIDQNTLHPNANFFSNTNTNFYPSTQQMNVIPSQTISLGNSLPLTNAQFTVSLPLGSVSYSTSQQQLIAQPSLTNVQYIHDPILSSVAHEVGPINTEVLTQIPSSNIVSQIHPQQQVVYSGIIHNSSVSLPQHHTLQPQFTLISSDSQNHSQLISAPLPVGSTNPSGHIISPVAVAHPNQSQNQQYTISQQPPVGVSIFSVATPCSLLSASNTTADVMQTIQQQHQLRSYDQNDQACMVKNGLNGKGNLEFSINDNSHINSTLTPIYIQHSLPSAVPVTQYRVTALESTATPGIVIHNPIDRNNLTLVHATSSNNHSDKTISIEDSFMIKPLSRKYSGKPLPDKYNCVIEENEKLRKKLMDLQKHTNDLQTANELLLDQNARLRNSKSSCNLSGGNQSLESNSINNQDTDNGMNSCNNHSKRYSTNLNNNNNNQSLLSKQNETVSNSMPEMATITLTVPLGKPLITESLDHSLSSSSSLESFLTSSCTAVGSLNTNKTINYSMPTTNSNSSSRSNTESYHNNVLSTSVCTDYISPTLVTSAIRSIQKSVMPTLHALVASSNAMNKVDCSMKQNKNLDNGVNNCTKHFDFSVDCNPPEHSVPITTSSSPATPMLPLGHDGSNSSSSSKTCCFRHNDFCHTAQLCFQ